MTTRKFAYLNGHWWLCEPTTVFERFFWELPEIRRRAKERIRGLLRMFGRPFVWMQKNIGGKPMGKNNTECASEHWISNVRGSVLESVNKDGSRTYRTSLPKAYYADRKNGGTKQSDYWKSAETLSAVVVLVRCFVDQVRLEGIERARKKEDRVNGRAAADPAFQGGNGMAETIAAAVAQALDK